MPRLKGKIKSYWAMRSHRIQQRGSVTTAKTVQTESAFQVALLSLFLPFHSFEVSSYSEVIVLWSNFHCHYFKTKIYWMIIFSQDLQILKNSYFVITMMLLYEDSNKTIDVFVNKHVSIKRNLVTEKHRIQILLVEVCDVVTCCTFTC